MALPSVPDKRKYQTEVTLVIATCDAYVLRPQELGKFTPPADPACHLYLVASRPRLSIHPASVTVTDDEVSGVLRIQQQDQYNEFPFTSRHTFGSGATFHAEWPHEEFWFEDADGNQVMSGAVGLLGRSIGNDWPKDADRLEVLYAGQAFGKDGDRTAWDRLARHETVQKILAECPTDRQIWLSLLTIIDVALAYEMLPPTGDEMVSDEQDDQHIAHVIGRTTDDGFADKEAVALAEGGLIRYFQPRYNDRMKHTFPARRQVSLETVRDLDLHGLVVELQSEESGMQYYSDGQRPRLVHFGGFEVHTDPNRAVTLAMSSVGKFVPAFPVAD